MKKIKLLMPILGISAIAPLAISLASCSCKSTETGVVTVSSISISSNPEKTVYNHGKKLSLTGLKVRVDYTDGKTKTIEPGEAGLTTDPADGTTLTNTEKTAKTQEVTVKYKNKTAKFNITVKPEIVVAGAACVYAEGESSLTWTKGDDGSWLKYSFDGENWTSADANPINFGTSATGNKLFIRGKLINSNSFNKIKLTKTDEFSGTFKISGSLMNLLQETEGTPSQTLKSNAFNGLFEGSNIFEIGDDILPCTDLALATNCYANMFKNCQKLKSIPGGLLPATKLTTGCYESMFEGCTGLTSLPENLLQSTDLWSSCYKKMFSGCKKLESVHNDLLPAKDLSVNNGATSCYEEMFSSCWELKNAPALPAEKLTNSCYKKMFFSCHSIETAPALKTTDLTSCNNCYEGMFMSCSGLTTAPNLPATTLAEGCYKEMFRMAYGLEQTPQLPATTLEASCYESMFNTCINLKSISKINVTEEINVNSCMKSMFECAGCNKYKIVVTTDDTKAFIKIPTIHAGQSQVTDNMFYYETIGGTHVGWAEGSVTTPESGKMYTIEVVA